MGSEECEGGRTSKGRRREEVEKGVIKATYKKPFFLSLRSLFVIERLFYLYSTPYKDTCPFYPLSTRPDA